MKITLYKKAPICPKCKVPMQFESMTYSDKIQKKVDCENHKWLLERKEEMSYRKGKYFYYEKCEKCGETRMVTESEREINSYTGFFYLYDASLYRCPKCLDLYKIEGEDKHE